MLEHHVQKITRSLFPDPMDKNDFDLCEIMMSNDNHCHFHHNNELTESIKNNNQKQLF